MRECTEIYSTGKQSFGSIFLLSIFFPLFRLIVQHGGQLKKGRTQCNEMGVLQLKFLQENKLS